MSKLEARLTALEAKHSSNELLIIFKGEEESLKDEIERVTKAGGDVFFMPLPRSALAR